MFKTKKLIKGRTTRKKLLTINIILFILSLIAFIYSVSHSLLFWMWVFFGTFAMSCSMFIFEIILFSIKKRKLPTSGLPKKPKVFEFGFFVLLFIATLIGTITISQIFLQDSHENVIDIFWQTFWFSGIYGIALASGIYHYILREDEDD